MILYWLIISSTISLASSARAVGGTDNSRCNQSKLRVTDDVRSSRCQLHSVITALIAYRKFLYESSWHVRLCYNVARDRRVRNGLWTENSVRIVCMQASKWLTSVLRSPSTLSWRMMVCGLLLWSLRTMPTWPVTAVAYRDWCRSTTHGYAKCLTMSPIASW